MPLPLAGYNTSATVNGTSVALTEWTVKPEVDDLDASNTEAGGVHIAMAGLLKCEITLTGFYDGSVNPFALGNSTGLMPGSFVDLVIFVNDNLDVGSLSSWNFVIDVSANQYGAMVMSYENKGNIKEKVMFTARLIGSGEFYYPEGDI